MGFEPGDRDSCRDRCVESVSSFNFVVLDETFWVDSNSMNLLKVSGILIFNGSVLLGFRLFLRALESPSASS